MAKLKCGIGFGINIMADQLVDIHALWIGKKLGALSSCCLRSFIMRGHNVYLHTYGHIEDIPVGVKIVDANNIITKEKIFVHKKTGSYALFSDVFRYELLKKIDGVYVDCDVYCIKPLLKSESDYILGYQDDFEVNGAVLGLPKESLLLQSLLDAAYDPFFIPPWYPIKKQKRLKFKKMLGFGKHISNMPWGIIGPEAISYFVKKLELEDKVQPIDVFYPIHFLCIKQLLDPLLAIEEVTTSRTICIHLFNEMLKKVDFHALDENSLLSKMMRNEI